MASRDEKYDECNPCNFQEEHSSVQGFISDASTKSLPDQAREFVREHGLDEHTWLFERAILLARDPANFELIPELDDDERQVLRDEIAHKWRLPKAMWMTTIVCSIGAAVQGWDEPGSNGANLSFPTYFGIGSGSARDQLLVGLINAMPALAICCVGCWLSEPLNNLLGRRGAIFVAAILAFASVLGSAFTQQWYQLLACRVLLGIGEGIKTATTPVFAAEGAPAAIRGSLVMGWQLWTAFGMCLGFASNIIVANCGSIAWRLQIGSAFIPAIPLMLLIYSCPESPRWYLKQRRIADAFASLLKLRNHPILASRDLLIMHASLEQELAIIRKSGNALARFGQLFTIPRVRRANLAACVVMLSQQMCGINIIAFYSSSVFTGAGVTAQTALWASFGFGVLTFLSALPALKIIDTFGRRSLLLATFPHMAWSLLATGLCFLIPADEVTARLAGITLFIFLFGIFYSLGDGPVCFLYAAEVFPLSHREVGMAWAVCVNAMGSFTLALTFPYMREALTSAGSFGLYCGLNVLAFVAIFLWVPETRQFTLEELDYTFSIPTNVYMRHQLTKTLPGWCKKWLLWRKNVEIEPLRLPNHLVEKPEDSEDSA